MRLCNLLSSRRNLSQAINTIFVVYAPHVTEGTGSEIRPRGYVILRYIRYVLTVCNPCRRMATTLDTRITAATPSRRAARNVEEEARAYNGSYIGGHNAEK